MQHHDYNNPIHAVRQVLANANTFKGTYYDNLKKVRKNLLITYSIMTILIFGTAGVLQHLLVEDYWIRYRPFALTFLYWTYTAILLATQDWLRFRNEFFVGWVNMQRISIESAEDLIQRQAERGYYPYNPSDHPEPDMTAEQRKALVEDERRELAPALEPLQLPEGTYEDPPVLNKTIVSTGMVNTKFSTLLVGATGTGKTTLLMNVVGEAVSLKRKVIVFDCKPKPGSFDKFNGHITYHKLDRPEDTAAFVAALKAVYEEMTTRTEADEPMHVIIDEINNGLSKAKLQMKTEGSKAPRYSDLISSYTELIISQARASNMPTVYTTHDCTAEALGISAQMRSNFLIVILASPTHRDNISVALSGQVKVISNEEERQRLKEEYSKIQDQLEGEYFSLSNVGGRWRFVK